MYLTYPLEFFASGWNIGLKKDEPDFGIIYSSQVCSAAAVFTKNSFPGHPITVGREHIKDGKLQAIIVNSGNANVATGPQGLELVYKCCREAGKSLGISHEYVLPSSTGVIARPLPENPILNACKELKSHISKPDFIKFSKAIMTTDAYQKSLSIELESGITLTGIAKGAGMIQPDMATMLAYLITDAQIDTEDLDTLLKSVVNKSFNRISVDSDTSTSDTVVILANGASKKKLNFHKKSLNAINKLSYPISEEGLALLPLDNDSRDFVKALFEITINLAKLIAADGEGATKLIELTISGALDSDQAISIGRSVINSPLVKTAVYGADPNWGRLLMAIGKTADPHLQLEKVEIFFGDFQLKGELQTEKELQILSKYLNNTEIQININLGLGFSRETFWGCDLTEDYVRLNSRYTT